MALQIMKPPSVAFWFGKVGGFEHPTRQKGVEVRHAYGMSQGSQLLQTGLQSCCDGLAEGETSPSWPSKDT